MSKKVKTRFRLLSWRESLLNPPKNNWTSLLRTRSWKLFLTSLHRENVWWIRRLLSSFAKIVMSSKEHAMHDMLTKFSWELERNNRVKLILWNSWTRLVYVLAREIWCTRLLRKSSVALLRKSNKELIPNQTIKLRSDSSRKWFLREETLKHQLYKVSDLWPDKKVSRSAWNNSRKSRIFVNRWPVNIFLLFK